MFEIFQGRVGFNFNELSRNDREKGLTAPYEVGKQINQQTSIVCREKIGFEIQHQNVIHCKKSKLLNKLLIEKNITNLRKFRLMYKIILGFFF